MKKTIQVAAVAMGAMLAMGGVNADSDYGYSTDGSNVTAQANVNLRVTIPKLILLRVGSAFNTVDELSWTIGPNGIPGVPTTPAVGNNTAVDWNGTAPAYSAVAAQSVNVFAWTNASNATINCSVGAWSSTGGPSGADFSVTASGATSLPHPGANLGSCTSTAFPSNSLRTGSWSFSLDDTNAASWASGEYTATVTYTATGI